MSFVYVGDKDGRSGALNSGGFVVDGDDCGALVLMARDNNGGDGGE